MWIIGGGRRPFRWWVRRSGFRRLVQRPVRPCVDFFRAPRNILSDFCI